MGIGLLSALFMGMGTGLLSARCLAEFNTVNATADHPKSMTIVQSTQTGNPTLNSPYASASTQDRLISEATRNQLEVIMLLVLSRNLVIFRPFSPCSK